MSLEEMIRNQPPFVALPTWRKSAIVCCIAVAIVTGALTFNRDMNIYGGAPDHPVVATGQTFPVSVNHGSTRYVTQREEDNFGSECRLAHRRTVSDRIFSLDHVST